jgi:hypothetical protein
MTKTKLTVLDIPKHRVLNGRLVLHYHTKEHGWISSGKFHALIRKGAKVRYA